ncbi:class I SAM-dependent methyltransferase [Bradyrhizobium prioriisuperbiae]|uniref:class I SAM-dependent methyltransferase n=1 Tax=Bradyrhizobium prioriisuperbiae TaxID=2854389 RepID=UPI0028EA1213|nr:methyltransferase domain-containing protein [Bradyrhizobium prioritasuperba]
MTIPGFFKGTGMPAPGWWEALWPEPARVITAMGIEPGMTVVDLCSGDGWFTLQLARIARHVIAVDIDDMLMATSRTRLQEAGMINCTCVVADAYDLARVVGSPVDHVFLANVLHGVPDQRHLVRLVRDVLKPAGLFAVVNWHARPREQTVVLGEPRGPATELRMTPQQTIEAIEPAGLALQAQSEVSPYHYGLVFRRF